jgi:hypothetical protein
MPGYSHRHWNTDFRTCPVLPYSKGVDISKNMLEAAAKAKEDFLTNHPGGQS